MAKVVRLAKRVDRQRTDEQVIQKFEREHFECLPQAPWIFQATNAFNQKGWYIRITVNGLYPRRYGPFETVEAATEAYYVGLDRLYIVLDAELFDATHINNGGRRHIIEDELAFPSRVAQEA